MSSETVHVSDSRVKLDDLIAIAMMNRRVVAISTLVGLLAAAIATAFVTPQYRATALLQLSPNQMQEVQTERPIDLQVRGFQEIERFYRTQFEIMKTLKIRVEVLRRYHELGFTDIPEAGGLAPLVAITPRERSELVEVSVTHPSPESAAALATLVGQVYVEANLDSRRDSARDAQTWLDAKLEEYEARVLELSAGLLTFKGEREIVDVEERVTSLTSRVAELDRSYGQVSAERVLLSTRVKSHRRLLGDRRYAELADVLEDPLLTSLATLHADARTDHAGIASRYGEKHPEFVRSKTRLDRIEAELRRETLRAVEAEEAVLQMLMDQEASLLHEIEAAGADLLERQALQTEFASLRMEYQRAEDFLKRLRARSDELDLSSRTQLNNVLLYQEATPPQGAISPRPLLNVGLGAFAGLLGGLIFAFLRFWLDDTMATGAEITASLHLPMLGSFPFVEPIDGVLPELATWVDAESVAAESARSLRAILALHPTTRDLKRLLITSSVASEGKTSTCVRVAIAYAQFGKRVALVEADHRRGRLHRVFGLQNEIGVLGCLTGQCALDDALSTTEVPNLSVLPLGPRLGEAPQLLDSQAMDDLLLALDERFDLIIIDSPPALTMSDVIHLSKRVDGTLLVVRSRAVSRTIARLALDRLQQVGANVLGVVLNHADRDSESTFSGYYGYRYARYYRYAAPTSQDGDQRAVSE